MDLLERIHKLWDDEELECASSSFETFCQKIFADCPCVEDKSKQIFPSIGGYWALLFSCIFQCYFESHISMERVKKWLTEAVEIIDKDFHPDERKQNENTGPANY